VRAAGLSRQISDQRTRLRTAGSAGKCERYWDLNRRNPINHSAATTVWIFLATHVRRCLIGRQPDNPKRISVSAILYAGGPFRARLWRASDRAHLPAMMARAPPLTCPVCFRISAYGLPLRSFRNW
jgi:hypothetical protein